MAFEFSLVITTFNRFDTFLDKHITNYLNNKYISEIIISDDCSGDYDKLINKYSSNPKIKIVQQPQNIGALKNKISACTHATREWICLMDSDNYCDIDYFDALISYWSTNPSNKTTIYSPVDALPRFNFSEYLGKTIDITNWKPVNGCLTNLGNNVFHKSIVPYMTPILSENIEVFAMDVKYINYKLFSKGVNLVVVPNMRYNHALHAGSFYINTESSSIKFDAAFNWDM